MGKCIKCGTNFVGTAENPPGDGLCRYCEIDQLKSTLTHYESALKEAKVDLDRLSKLGNEPHLGNSFGNRIAQDALAKINKVLGEK